MMKVESPSGELLRMKEVIPDEPMSPDEEPGRFILLKFLCHGHGITNIGLQLYQHSNNSFVRWYRSEFGW